MIAAWTDITVISVDRRFVKLEVESKPRHQHLSVVLGHSKGPCHSRLDPILVRTPFSLLD